MHGRVIRIVSSKIWFDRISELGYAKACNKKIFISIQSDLIKCRHDLWFVNEFILLDDNSNNVINSENITDAFNQFCEFYNLSPIPACIKSPIEEQFYKASRKQNLELIPQFKIRVDGNTFYADFLVPKTDIVIELDGHEFHKTKEQRTNDAKRGRLLQQAGYTVIRFTGTEIYENVDGCVYEVKLLEKTIKMNTRRRPIPF